MPVPDSNAIAAIRAERRNQDAEWGGPSHDDAHAPFDWLEIAAYQIDKAYSDSTREETDVATAVRARLVKLAAVALAGIQSIDRATTAA